MSWGAGSEATAAAELALAVYRAPARHAELLRGNAPLPSSVTALLRLAGGTAPEELDPALAALAPADELRKAALFFIEQVLFQRDASHYRLLGLNQSAAPEQVKEHHRLLMRLFHPDRDSYQLDERREQFATRANLAYNALRDADSRARYDETLKPAPARAQVHRSPPAAVRRPVPQPESFWSVQLHPSIMRHLPQWVLAGTALVSVSIVGAVYLYNPPVPVPPAGAPDLAETAPDARTEAYAASADPLEEEAARFERKISEMLEAKRLAAAQNEPAVAPQTPAPADLPAAPQPASRLSRQPADVITAPAKPAVAIPDRPVRKPAVVASLNGSVAARKPVPDAAGPAPAAPAAVPPPAAEPARPGVAAEAPVAVAATPALEPALPDPNTLLGRFLEAYEKGDVRTCMSLLDEGMRAKQDLRREYDTLFRSTDLRHIKVQNMNWSREGDSIRGEGQYRLTMMRKGETLLKSQSGQFRVELIRRGNTALINDLQYIASGRS